MPTRVVVVVMNADTDAVGGFFEDLPVMAFVLAGVLSVAGTASWTAQRLADVEGYDSLETLASRLIVDVTSALGAVSEVPSMDGVRGTELSGVIGSLPADRGCAISVWCVHPRSERLLFAATGDVGSGASCAGWSFLNVRCEDGVIGILEVRAVVWEDG